jgi:site-specific DNA recombinase
MKRTSNAPAPVPKAIRCAIYTRKSSEEGLEQEFNSLDAQRDSGEAYIRSQAGEGWELLPDNYNDGGFTGGNMDRPAVKRLMADIAAGRIDVVVVYKVDRLSRSLLDFARMMQAFEEHKVSFVSVTQQFNTASSMGRLVLNVLLSFAQFEREIISERTRDKIAATRRKGKWSGGHPILGYNVDPVTLKLHVNEPESEKVRAIFKLYVEHESLLPVVQELDRRGWTNKRWQTRKGGERGGRPFDRTSLYRLITNPVYLGKVKYKTELHAGEHAAIVDAATWQKVQAILERNGRSGGAPVRNQFGALLKGILRCGPCGCAMTPTHSTKPGRLRYRYYVCSSASKNGWATCPSKSAPAGQIESLVVNQIKAIGRDDALVRRVLEQARRQDAERKKGLDAERRVLAADVAGWYAEIRTVTAKLKPGDDNCPAIDRLSELQQRVFAGEAKLKALKEQAASADAQVIDEAEAIETLAAFEPIWTTLTPREQTRVVQLLVEQVEYDGSRGKVSIAFRAAGISTLAEQFAEKGATV